MISYSHDTMLVVASIVVSMVAAFTGLELTNNISQLPDWQRKALVVMSSFVLGIGIWSMHFVAMLAHKFQIPVYYDLLQTLSSALVAILVVGISLLLLHFTVRTPRILIAAGLTLGIGILSMHYIGMIGIRGVDPLFSTTTTVLSVVVAAVMGVAAIMVAYGRRSKQNIIVGSLLMGFSVVTVHFTAMHGTQFTKATELVPDSAVLASSTLAVIVTVTAFVICGSFLLAATTFLTSESSTYRQRPLASELVDARPPAGQLPGPEAVHSAIATNPETANPDKPLAAIGKPSPGAPDKPGALKVPFERDKKIGFAMSDEVAAIRADGHYTQLYTRDGIRFCPWSITEAEKRLTERGFHRTHRSYLVNVNAISRFEKRRETGICIFETYPQLATVPVSRNRVLGLMDVLDTSVLL